MRINRTKMLSERRGMAAMSLARSYVASEAVLRPSRRMASTTTEPLQVRGVAAAAAPKNPKVNKFGIPLLPEGLREKLFAKEETTGWCTMILHRKMNYTV